MNDNPHDNRCLTSGNIVQVTKAKKTIAEQFICCRFSGKLYRQYFIYSLSVYQIYLINKNIIKKL